MIDISTKLNFELWRTLTKLYLSDPTTHVYLMYDLIYELDKTSVLLNVEDRVSGYVLIWRGMRSAGVHVWGEAHSLIKHIPRDVNMVIHVYSNDLFEPILNHLKGYGNVSIWNYLDMIVDEASFKPYMPDRAVRLNSSKISDFIELKKVQGRMLTFEDALKSLENWRYYGVYADDVLASIACTYVRMPEIWMIGDVYTKPEFRGRGFAKIATSAITRDAINSGAKAMLHVREDNLPAIKVYENLGYKKIRSKKWIYFTPFS